MKEGRRAFYKRFPGDFMMGTRDLTLEERGAYNDILDMLYDRGRPLPDEPKWIAGLLGISVKKWRTIRQALIDSGKLVERGEFLSNVRFEREADIQEATHTAAVTWGSKGGRVRAMRDKQAREAVKATAQPDLFGGEKPVSANFGDILGGFSEDFGEDKSPETKPKPNKNNDKSQASLKPARAFHNQSPDKKSDSTLFTGAKSRNGSRLSPTWEPDPLTEEVELIVGAWPDGLVAVQLARFRDYWTGKSGKDATKVDWNATWRNWIRKADDDWKRAGARPLGKPSGWAFAGNR